MTKDTAAIRDQLGKDPDVTFFLDADYFETVGVEEQSTIVKNNTLGNAWIVGTSTNGIVGTNTGTGGGGQQVVGGSGRVEIRIRVVNPLNTFRDHFRDEDFKDTDAPNTADWNTTTFRLAMNTATDQSRQYTSIANFKTIFLNSQTVIRATVNSTETKYTEGDLIKYWLSADGGTSWEEFTKGVERTFTTQGTDLRARIIFLGQGGEKTYIEDLQVSYVV